MEQKYPYVGGKMGASFTGFTNSMGFTAFSHAMGNWWGNPYISHIIKYTIGSDSNGKEAPYSGKSMRTNLPDSPHTIGFVGFSWKPISQAFPIWWVFLPFPMLREIDEKTHGFPIWWSIPQDGNLVEKKTHTMGKVWVPISQVLHIQWVL